MKTINQKYYQNENNQEMENRFEELEVDSLYNTYKKRASMSIIDIATSIKHRASIYGIYHLNDHHEIMNKKVK